jgi:DNA-binding CsgD family transcriptional regulator
VREELIGLIYQAVEHPQEWLTFLDALLTHERFHAAAVGYQVSLHDALITGFIQGPDEAHVESFYRDAIPGDPFAPHHHALRDGIYGFVGSRLLSAQTREASPYYAWMRGIGADEVLLTGNRLDHDTLIHFPVFLPLGCEPTPDDMDLLKALVPHITHAFHLSRRMVELETSSRHALHALESVSVGCFLLNEHGKVEWSNMYAQRLLDQGDVLALIDDELYAHSNESQASRLLELCVLEPSAHDSHGPPQGRLAMHIAPHIEVRISPLSSFGHPIMSTRQGTLVMVADTNYLDRGIAERLQALYDLSAAEAEVTTWLLSGYTVENISHILEKSHHTVRHQIKHAMKKCGVSSQTQLVGLIHRGLASMS